MSEKNVIGLIKEFSGFLLGALCATFIMAVMSFTSDMDELKSEVRTEIADVKDELEVTQVFLQKAERALEELKDE